MLWFATKGGGVSRFDGQIFQILTRQDGLGSNVVWSISQGHDEVWLGTDAGVTRYRPPPRTPPRVALTAVVADQRYTGVSELSIPSTVSLTAFEFAGYSFKTRPGGIVFRYRLNGYDVDWRVTRPAAGGV